MKNLDSRLKDIEEYYYIASADIPKTSKITQCDQCGRVFEKKNPFKKAAIKFCAACSLRGKEYLAE